IGYRMRLGRDAMVGKIIVDPESRFLLGHISEEDLVKQYNKNVENKSGLKIGLLASNADLYSNRRIIETGERLGHHIEFFNIRQCYMKLDAKTPEIHYRGGKKLNDMDAVIPRIKPSLTYYGCALTRQFEALNIFCL